MTTPLTFTYGENNRTLWSGQYIWRGMADARSYARTNGAAGVWHADDSFTLLFMSGGKLRQKKWAKASPAKI